MRLCRLAGIGWLTIALMPGCAWYQSLAAKFNRPASSSQTGPASPSALEPKLEAMDHRLERIELMLTDVRNDGQRRQRQEEQSQQSLAGLRQETRNTRAALARLQKQLATQHAAVVARLGETAANQADFWAVDISMGPSPNGGGQDHEARRIPAQVPDRAREILVYAQVATGYVKAGPHRFRISVRVEGAREAAFYLYAVGHPQPSWAYNSDNVWLPMPRDRQLFLRAEGEPFFGDWSSEVRVIAYR